MSTDADAGNEPPPPRVPGWLVLLGIVVIAGVLGWLVYARLRTV